MSRAAIFWFTGLSGSGKTTVATAIKSQLEHRGLSVLLLDGDHVRENLNTNLGFTEHDIKQNNLSIAKLCKRYREIHDIILVSVISPYKSSRKMAREILGKDFYEIYFSADLATVSERDVKGLYAKAKNGEIDNLIGYSPGNVYQPPEDADYIVNSGVESMIESVEALHSFITERLNVRISCKN